MKLKPILIGMAIGAIAGWFMGSSQAKGGNPLGITGKFAQPFQANIDTGKGVRGG